MKKRSLVCFGILATVWMIGCATKVEQPGAMSAGLAEELQALVDSVAASPEIPGALLTVHAPRIGLDWQGAAGLAEVGSAEALTVDRPLRIASNTKTFVAVAVLRLWEMGKLDLDDSAKKHLDPELVAILEADGYDFEAITLRHLLTHTAGLIDHTRTDEFGQAIEADPQRRWQRIDHIRGAADWGDPLGPPEEAFVYSDTGYVLLGRVVENVSGKPLASAVRELVGYEELGLDSTWWETLEDAPAGVPPRIHQYIGGQDTYDWDPSFDLYGGGGLASTLGDQVRFWRGLFHGKIFTDPKTLEVMLTTPIEPEVPGYRMGVFAQDFDGLEVYEHSGFWGTQALNVPELDLAVAGAVTEQQQARALFQMMRDAVAKAREVQSASHSVSSASG